MPKSKQPITYQVRIGTPMEDDLRDALKLAHKHNRPVRVCCEDTCFMRVGKRMSLQHLHNQWRKSRRPALMRRYLIQSRREDAA